MKIVHIPLQVDLEDETAIGAIILILVGESIVISEMPYSCKVVRRSLLVSPTWNSAEC